MICKLRNVRATFTPLGVSCTASDGLASKLSMYLRPAASAEATASGTLRWRDFASLMSSGRFAP